MKPNIGISDKHKQEIVIQLSKLLADEFILYTKTRNAHWNLEGKDFHGLHLFFEEQFKQLDEIIDDVAERIRSLGHYAPGTLKIFLGLTHLSENESGENDSTSFIDRLLEDHNGIILFIRGNIDPFATEYKDYGSSDLITGILSIHEKMSWMLSANLKQNYLKT